MYIAIDINYKVLFCIIATFKSMFLIYLLIYLSYFATIFYHEKHYTNKLESNLIIFNSDIIIL